MQNDRREPQKPKWIDPVKGQTPHNKTLEIRGDFQEFKSLMRRIIHRPEKETKPSSSRGPDVS